MECFQSWAHRPERYTYLYKPNDAVDLLYMIQVDFEDYYLRKPKGTTGYLLIPLSAGPVISHLSGKPLVMYVTVQR